MASQKSSLVGPEEPRAQPRDDRMARLAHELNAPVSLIAGSLENLDQSLASIRHYIAATVGHRVADSGLELVYRQQGVEGELTAVNDLLAICREGVGRIGHLARGFRASTSYRLSVFTVRTPALRERADDIPLLAQHFLENLARNRGKAVRNLTNDAIGLPTAHDFPGNVRELQNEIERAFTLAEPDGYVTPDLLSEKFQGLQARPAPNGGTLRANVERYEADFIREALERNEGNKSRTATGLGLSRRSFLDKLIKYGMH